MKFLKGLVQKYRLRRDSRRAFLQKLDDNAVEVAKALLSGALKDHPPQGIEVRDSGWVMVGYEALNALELTTVERIVSRFLVHMVKEFSLKTELLTNPDNPYDRFAIRASIVLY